MLNISIYIMCMYSLGNIHPCVFDDVDSVLISWSINLLIEYSVL